MRNLPLHTQIHNQFHILSSLYLHLNNKETPYDWYHIKQHFHLLQHIPHIHHFHSNYRFYPHIKKKIIKLILNYLSYQLKSLCNGSSFIFIL